MMNRSFGGRAVLRAGVGLFCVLSLTPFVAGQEKSALRTQVDELLKGMGKARRLGPVAVSPDGTLLAFVRADEDGWRVQLAPMSDLTKTTRVSAAKGKGAHCGEGMVAWAPDSRRLAFVGACQPGSEGDTQDDVFVATVGGDFAAGKPKVEVEKLTAAKGEVGFPSWAPDGSKLAFLYVEGATREAGALAAMKPWAGVIGEDGVEIQRVATVDAGARKAAPVFATPANLHVYEFDWRPDSKGLAYVAAAPPGENNWWVAKLYTQELGAEAKAIFAPAEATGGLHGLQIAVPRWSPDGQAIAFIGGLMSDQGSTGGDVWIVPAAGGEARDLTPSRPSSPAWISWADNEHIFVSEFYGGNSQLVRMHIDGDRTAAGVTTSFGSPVYSLAGTVGDGRLELSLSATRDHSVFVFNASSFDHPMEIYAAKPSVMMGPGLEGLMQLTHFNDAALAGDGPVWGKSTSLHWKNEGFNVQGWLHFPKGFDSEKAGSGKKYPLIVLVHGGPSASATSHWGGGSLSGLAFSAMGYFVLEANPRGSFGQGEAFTAANRKDFGYGDLRDILAGVDTVLAKYPVDAGRVGLTGWSYGGFMTMFAVTQTGRFKAAVAGAGISNWQSYYGENSIDQWMTPFFGASVYSDPAVYAKSSAINFIDKVKTPTLVVVGDRDGECPAPQSFEFWHALRDEHVSTQLVVYPNEGHGFVSAEHRTDVLVRALDWFAKYMPAGE
jgi:dipeptidyl aminopeptidase/acylaminoacyl peptidase